MVPTFGRAGRLGLPAQRGKTLLEMLIVVAIIGMAAAVAVPSSSSARLQQLNLAGSELADAFRFAREEARRTGVVHGVSTETANGLVRVFRLDEDAIPNLKIYDVRHPVSRQLYAIRIGESPHAGVLLDGFAATTVGACNDAETITFDSAGVVRCSEPTSTRIENAVVTLAVDQLLLSVAIDGYTGRVTVQ